MSSRSSWKAYSSEEFYPENEFDDSTSFSTEAPVFKSFMTQVSDKSKCLFLSFLFLIFNSLLWLKLNIFVKCDIMVTYRLICCIQTYRAFMTNVAVSAHYHLETREYGE